VLSSTHVLCVIFLPARILYTVEVLLPFVPSLSNILSPPSYD
jgi:hypothetical protein